MCGKMILRSVFKYLVLFFATILVFQGPAFAAKDVDVKLEISETQSILESPSNDHQRRVYELYLNALLSISKETFPVENRSILLEVLELHSVIKEIGWMAPFEHWLLVKEIIHAFKTPLDDQRPILFFSMSLGYSMCFRIWIDSNRRVHLTPIHKDYLLGQGSFKIVRKDFILGDASSGKALIEFFYTKRPVHDVERYRDEEWNNYLKLRLLSVEERDYFIQEPEVATGIGQGLPIWLQTLYPVNLESLSRRRYDSFSFGQRLDALYQLSTGLDILHNRLRMTHQDVKLQNVFCSFEPQIKCRWADLGFSLYLPDYVKKYGTIADAGTQEVLAPEATQPWTGSADEERIQEATKSDIYSFGLMAFILMQNQRPWARECSSQRNFADFKVCRGHSLENFFLSEMRSLNYSLHQMVFFQAIQERPQDRIGTTELKNALAFLLLKTSFPSDSQPTSWEVIQSLFANSPGFSPLDPKGAHEELRKLHAPAGTYILHPIMEFKPNHTVNTGQDSVHYKLAITFVAQYGNNRMISTKILDVDPRDKDQIEQELRYLGLIGVFKQTLNEYKLASKKAS